MFLSTAPEIRVESFGNDVRYDLPPRPLGKLRLIGLLPLLFSVFFISMPFKFLLETLQHATSGKGGGFEWMIVAFLSLFVFAGLMPMWFGLILLGGRCRVDWRDGRLSVADYVGPLRWRRRFQKSAIRKLTVAAGGARVNDQPVTTGPLVTLGALTAEFETGKPRMVALGYPRDWLQALADDLSSRVGAMSVASKPEVEVVDASENPPQFTDVITRPTGSQVNIEHSTAGLKIVIAPAGLRKGSKGFFFFGIAWCAFLSLFTGLMIFGKDENSHRPPWFVWIFVAVFWLIGLSLLAGAINMGRRRATISVTRSELQITQDGLFGTKSRTWRREEISAVRADASGLTVNNVPVIELQIHPVAGKKAGLLAGRNEEELRWIATEMRQALNVPATKDLMRQSS